MTKGAQAPAQKYIIRDVRPEEVIHRKINVGPAEVRGRSDFASILGWLGLLDDFFQAVVARERASAGVGIDVSVDGGEQDILAVMQNFVIPSVEKAGSANFHGNNVEVKDISFEPAQSVAPGSTFEGLMTLIANGIVFPRAYLNAGGDDMTKAGTLTSTATFAKHVRGCQTEEREMMEELLADVLAEYASAGMLDQVDLENVVVNLEFPEIVEADAKDDVPLLEQGVSMDFLSHKTAGLEYARRVRIRAYDYDKEQSQIVKDRALPDGQQKGIWRNMAITFYKPQPISGGQTGVGSGGAGTHPDDGTPDSSDDMMSQQGQSAVAQASREAFRVLMRETMREMLREVVTPEALADAANNVHRSPSDAQIEAGNYSKGHVRFPGFDVSIENARGQQRSGTGKDGEKWSVTMPAHYGYVRRTEGADGEQVDCYIGPNPQSGNVWVIDQLDADTGKFDEHKAMLGFNSLAEALAAYHRAFSDGKGPDRVGATHKMTLATFKEWLATDTTKAASAAL